VYKHCGSVTVDEREVVLNKLGCTECSNNPRDFYDNCFSAHIIWDKELHDIKCLAKEKI
jgi:hypothetical protein